MEANSKPSIRINDPIHPTDNYHAEFDQLVEDGCYKCMMIISDAHLFSKIYCARKYNLWL